MTNCNTIKLEFKGIKSKKVEANFKGGLITSDAGVLLLRQAEQKIGLLKKLSQCIKDSRHKSYTKHAIETTIKQRVFAIACGYEDLNDHNELRKDAMFKIAVDKKAHDSNLASSPTICRMENNITREELIEMSKILVENFIESFQSPPKELILDFDTTDTELHGNQEGRFFHGYYDSYCYLPLDVWCGQQLLVSYLRTANQDPAAHTWAILSLLVKRFRIEWPKVRIIFRGDGGFCRHKIFNWCDSHNVRYVVGIGKNNRLTEAADKPIELSRESFKEKGQKVQIYDEIYYAAKTWKYERKVIVKAEQLIQGENIRYLVTNIENKDPEDIYKLYIKRGDMENRIKEHQLDLFADRTSSHKFLTNQFRLMLASCAYVLLEYIRRVALKGTKLAKAYCGTIRIKLLKIGAIILEKTRKIIIRMSEVFVYKDLFIKTSRLLC